MQRERLTPDRIRRFSCPADAKQSFLWDTDAPRLAVRVTTGAKSFIFEAKLNRQTVRVTIGDVRAWNLDDARAEARRLQTLIDQGIDPRQEKADKLAAVEAKREEERRVEALALEAWNAYIEARKARWSEPHIRDHENVSKEGGEPRTRGRRKGESAVTLPGALRPLLLLPLARIDADRVRVWLEEEAARRPTHARLAFGLLRAFLNWCSDRPEYRDQIHADACTPRAARESLPKKAAKDEMRAATSGGTKLALGCGCLIAVVGIVSGGTTFGSGYAEARGLLDGNAVRDGCGLGGVQDDELAERAEPGCGGAEDELTRDELGCRPGGLDDAGGLLAEAGGQRHRVEPGAMIGVDEIDADRQVADLHLAGSRRRQAGLDPLQDVGAADAVKADETGHASPQADLYDTDCTGRSEADA